MMDDKNKQFGKNLNKNQKPMNQQSVSTYTTLRIMAAMRQQLGLEAMLQYFDHYLKTVEKYNPKLESAVTQAMQKMNIDKVYKDAMS